jgi:hypothetical protein
MDCEGSPWVEHKTNRAFEDNVNRLCTVQHWWKRWLPFRRLKRWLNSSTFAEWFYAPTGPGGVKAVQRLEHTAYRKKRLGEQLQSKSPLKRVRLEYNTN